MMTYENLLFLYDRTTQPSGNSEFIPTVSSERVLLIVWLQLYVGFANSRQQFSTVTTLGMRSSIPLSDTTLRYFREYLYGEIREIERKDH